MESVYTYQLTAKGGSHSRLEYSDGEPIRGKRNRTRPYACVHYTTMGRNSIRLTEVEAAKLTHLKLVRILGTGKSVMIQATDTGHIGHTALALDVGAAVVAPVAKAKRGRKPKVTHAPSTSDDFAVEGVDTDDLGDVE